MTFSCFPSKRRSLLALLLAVLIQPASSATVRAQATSEFIGFAQTEFDQIVKKNSFTDDGHELVPKLTSYFKPFCATRDLHVLENARFNCVNGICKTWRVEITTGSLIANKITKIYNFQVNLYGSHCPMVDVKVESEFTPAK